MKTERKRTLTLNMSEDEARMLAQIADKFGMAKSAVLRMAIRRMWETEGLPDLRVFSDK